MAQEHWKDIDANHIKALSTDEVLISPSGPNKFDDFGKKPYGDVVISLWTHKTQKC
jgi:hypothetical protein